MGGRKRKGKVQDEEDIGGLEAGEGVVPSRTKKKTGSKKADTPEKRADAFGNTVRYSASANQKIRDRISRALPGIFRSLTYIRPAQRSVPLRPSLQLTEQLELQGVPCRKVLSVLILDSGSGHRMFMLDRKTIGPLGSEGGPVEEFAILGATGNGAVCLSPASS